MSNELMSIADVAAFWGVSAPFVKRVIRRGDLPTVRLGARMLRIARTDAESFIRQRAETRIVGITRVNPT